MILCLRNIWNMIFYLTGQYKNKEKQIINNKWTTEILIRSRNTKNSLLNNLKEIFRVKFSFITKNLWKVFQTWTAYCPLYSFWLFFDSAFSIASSCGREFFVGFFIDGLKVDNEKKTSEKTSEHWGLIWQIEKLHLYVVVCPPFSTKVKWEVKQRDMENITINIIPLMKRAFSKWEQAFNIC